MDERCCSVRTLGAWPLAAVLLLLGCGAQAGGQTGEETGDACHFALTPLSLDEKSPLGFSAADVLKFSQGEQRAPLRWLPATDLPYGPEHGQGEITARVARRGNAEFAKPSLSAGDVACAEVVRIPITLELTTASGALDEHLDVRLVAASPAGASVSALLPANEVQGSFAFDATSLGTSRFTRLEIAVRFADGDFAGLIQGGIDSGTGESQSGATSYRPVPLACWGSQQGLNSAACDM